MLEGRSEECDWALSLAANEEKERQDKNDLMKLCYRSLDVSISVSGTEYVRAV